MFIAIKLKLVGYIYIFPHDYPIIILTVLGYKNILKISLPYLSPGEGARCHVYPDALWCLHGCSTAGTQPDGCTWGLRKVQFILSFQNWLLLFSKNNR